MDSEGSWLAGVPVDKPRRISPVLRYAPYVTGLAMGLMWFLLLLPLFHGCIALSFGDGGNEVRASLIVILVFSVPALVAGLWAFFRGGRKTQRAFYLLREGDVVSGRVIEMGAASFGSPDGKELLEFYYIVEYSAPDGKTNRIKEHHIDDQQPDALSALASLHVNPEEVAVFCDPNEPDFATTLITVKCRFSTDGVAEPASTYMMAMRFVPAALVLVAFFTYSFLLAYRLISS